jgi:hypothetical protein
MESVSAFIYKRSNLERFYLQMEQLRYYSPLLLRKYLKYAANKKIQQYNLRYFPSLPPSGPMVLVLVILGMYSQPSRRPSVL